MTDVAVRTVAEDLARAMSPDRVVTDPDILEAYRYDRAAFASAGHPAALELGGTITGEHGVGTLKRPYLAQMVEPAELALMARVRAAFDPAGILNPGKAL